ncbi:MAG: hypothetical protein NVSMB65_19980 [Chloroflexota bacterium]
MSALDRLLSHLHRPINADPLPRPALLSTCSDAVPHVSYLLVVLNGTATLWQGGRTTALGSWAIGPADGMTVGGLASGIAAALATVPVTVGMVPATLATSDRAWSTVPAALILDGSYELNTTLSPLYNATLGAVPIPGATSLLWGLFSAYARAFALLEADTATAVQHMLLVSSSTTWLDYLCALYGVTRQGSETDPLIVQRTRFRVGAPTANNAAIAATLLTLLGVKADVLDAPTPFRFNVRFLSVPAVTPALIAQTVRPLTLAGTAFNIIVPLPVLRPQYPYTAAGPVRYLTSTTLLPTTIMGSVFGTATLGANAAPPSAFYRGTPRTRIFSPQGTLVLY